MWMVSSPTTTTPTATTLHATIITDAPQVRVVGAHNDPADFYGIGLGLVAIAIAIAVTRLVFRRGGSPTVEGPRRPDCDPTPTAPAGPPPDGPG
jgi:hypothetical protein